MWRHVALSLSLSLCSLGLLLFSLSVLLCCAVILISLLSLLSSLFQCSDRTMSKRLRLDRRLVVSAFGIDDALQQPRRLVSVREPRLGIRVPSSQRVDDLSQRIDSLPDSCLRWYCSTNSGDRVSSDWNASRIDLGLLARSIIRRLLDVRPSLSLSLSRSLGLSQSQSIDSDTQRDCLDI